MWSDGRRDGKASALRGTVEGAAGKNDVTAIDILLEPDATMLQHSAANNARLLKVFPKGFALDATHRPHITLVQRFVRTADLDKVYAAAGKVFAAANVNAMKLEAFKYYYAPGGAIGVAGICAKPTPEILKLQADIIAAVTPFTVETGPIGAFTAPHDDPAMDAALIQYVSTFVPKMSGENFNPHVSTGVAPKSTSTRCWPNRLRRSPSRLRARPFTSSARSAPRQRNSKNGTWNIDDHRCLLEVKNLQKCGAAFPEAGNLRAREVDGAIARHQQLNRRDLPVVGRERAALMDKLVGEILDGVPQHLQRMTRFRADPSSVILSHLII